MMRQGYCARLAMLCCLLAGCTTSFGPVLQPVTGPANQPTLHWASFPSPQDLEDDPQGKLKEAHTITYELRVFTADRRIVYQRSAVREPEHQLNWGLESGKTYYWTVRPHFEIEGKPRVGHWSTIHCPDVFSWTRPLPLSAFASFRT